MSQRYGGRGERVLSHRVIPERSIARSASLSAFARAHLDRPTRQRSGLRDYLFVSRSPFMNKIDPGVVTIRHGACTEGPSARGLVGYSESKSVRRRRLKRVQCRAFPSQKEIPTGTLSVDGASFMGGKLNG